MQFKVGGINALRSCRNCSPEQNRPHVEPKQPDVVATARKESRNPSQYSRRKVWHEASLRGQRGFRAQWKHCSTRATRTIMKPNYNSKTVVGRKANRNAKTTSPMDILIHSDGVDLSTELDNAIRSKIGRLRQYARGALRARVQLHKLRPNTSPFQYRAHVLYEVRGNDVSAEHIAHDPLAALDLVAAKIKRRLRRRKTAKLAGRVRAHRAAASRVPVTLGTLEGGAR